MNQTRRKNIIRNIRQSLNRFLSIMFIVALGSGFIAGLAAASPDMYDTGDRYIDKYNLFDIDVKSLIGFDENDAEKISSIESVEGAQPSVVMDMILNQTDGSDYTSRVFGILDSSGQTSINKLNLIEGRMPESPDECVIESVFAQYSKRSVSVGDSLYLSETNTDYNTLSGELNNTELKVVGICQSPMCISIEGDSTNIGSGTIEMNVYTMDTLFNIDYYTDIFLTVSGAKELNTFNDEYNNLVSSIVDKIKSTGNSYESARKDKLIRDAESQIESAEKLSGYINDVSDIRKTMDNNLAVNIEKNKDTAASLPESSSLLYDQLNKTEDLLNSRSIEGSDSNGKLADAINSSISDAEDLLENIRESTWIIRTREDLAGYESYSSNVGKVSALAKIFPVFFFIVALLVALTTMTRLIEERRLQTGTLKALGYSNMQILSEYIIYSLSASVLGTIIGFAVGFVIFPYAINSAYKMLYTIPPISLPVRWDIVAWVAPVTIISILLATVWACWNEFRSMPARLMQPKTPPAGKRIWLEHIPFIWKKLSFTYKVTFRNLFRYKKRFIMTIIGVAGCSALLLTGFGIKDSVNEIIDKQFGEIFKYDMIFVTDDADSITQESQLNSLLNNKEKVSQFTTACQETGKIYSNSGKKELTLFIPSDPDNIKNFIEIRNRKNHTHYDLDDNSIVITEKLAEELSIKAGDIVDLEDSEGHRSQVQVSAIAENYVYSYAYMTPDVYEKLFNTEPEYSSILSLSASTDLDESNALLSEILADSHVLYGRSIYNLKDSFADSIQSINGVIYVLILAAGLLCIVVLYNLINVNICERKKELATLRVLGFYRSETQNYIFRETNILSFLGACAGLLVGIWLHSVVVRTVEVNSVMFGRDIKPLSYIIALAISVIFTLLVDLIMKRPINNTDMVDAMKSND